MKKGIGPKGLGVSPLKLKDARSCAKQAKSYKRMTRNFPNYNQKTDTIISTKGKGVLEFIQDVQNLKANNANAKEEKFFGDNQGNIEIQGLYNKKDVKAAPQKKISPLKKKDACYRKAKAKYDVFPSAYASGYIAKCRKKKGKLG